MSTPSISARKKSLLPLLSLLLCTSILGATSIEKWKPERTITPAIAIEHIKYCEDLKKTAYNKLYGTFLHEESSGMKYSEDMAFLVWIGRYTAGPVIFKRVIQLLIPAPTQHITFIWHHRIKIIEVPDYEEPNVVKIIDVWTRQAGSTLFSTDLQRVLQHFVGRIDFCLPLLAKLLSPFYLEKCGLSGNPCLDSILLKSIKKRACQAKIPGLDGPAALTIVKKFSEPPYCTKPSQSRSLDICKAYIKKEYPIVDDEELVVGAGTIIRYCGMVSNNKDYDQLLKKIESNKKKSSWRCGRLCRYIWSLCCILCRKKNSPDQIASLVTLPR